MSLCKEINLSNHVNKTLFAESNSNINDNISMLSDNRPKKKVKKGSSVFDKVCDYVIKSKQ
ncbi:13677_t:CDS:2 [Cetraspora pellucida]|uniref:13677_t:CDS:1 n=1 Tax=Cetraspora pellucida TaxID=1433469 RepID=A0A9N9B178_9GLOM|nr:13677_t:CDS:2 [Cetraspora pellucida]